MLRKCRVCGIEAHSIEDLELFIINRNCYYKRGLICKKCHNVKKREYAHANREQTRQTQRRGRRANPEKVREYRRKWYQKDKEKERQYLREILGIKNDKLKES